MIKLVCTSPFRGYVKGQEVTNPALVEALLRTHDRHFVKATNTNPEYLAPPAPAPKEEQK